MSTPNPVTIFGLYATKTSRVEGGPFCVRRATGEQLADVTVLDQFGNDAEIQPATQETWNELAPQLRANPHLLRRLQIMAEAPARMTTETGLLVLPGSDIGQLALSTDLVPLCLHVNTGKDDDAHQVVAQLVQALHTGEGVEAFDPAGVLDGSAPKTLLYPAKTDGAVRLHEVTVPTPKPKAATKKGAPKKELVDA